MINRKRKLEIAEVARTVNELFLTSLTYTVFVANAQSEIKRSIWLRFVERIE